MFAWKAAGTVLAAVAGFVYSGAALADGYSAPARYYAPSYSWSGLYVGVNAGAEWGRIDGSLPSAPGFPFNVDLDARFFSAGTPVISTKWATGYSV